MTKFVRLGVASVAMFAALGMGSAASAQQSATADARAEVLQPLLLEINANANTLDFGAIVIQSVAVGGTETLVLDPSGGLTCPATLVCRGTPANPQFTVTGTANKAVSITLPTGNVVLTTGAGATAQQQLVLNTFTSSAMIGADPAVLLDDTTGVGTFSVGGSLTLDQDQDAGIYTGSFQVSVEYS